jgi:hypothetical protein
MDRRSRYHAIFLPTLLVAMAIQGATPDAHDLASNKALQLLCPAVHNSSLPTDNDGFPDEVCGTIRTGIPSFFCESIHFPKTISVIAGSLARLTSRNILRSYPQACLVGIDGLPHFLCRWIC